jgi:hypothetical protein
MNKQLPSWIQEAVKAELRSLLVLLPTPILEQIQEAV